MKTNIVYVLESTLPGSMPMYFKEWVEDDWTGVPLPEEMEHLRTRQMGMAAISFSFHDAAHYETEEAAATVRDFLATRGYGYYAVREHEHDDDLVGEAQNIINAA
jgi:hypothetical protein